METQKRKWPGWQASLKWFLQLHNQANSNFTSRAGIKWRGRNNLGMITMKEKNAFQACVPFVLWNYINTGPLASCKHTRTHSGCLFLGPKMGASFSAFNKFGNFLSSILLFSSLKADEYHAIFVRLALFECLTMITVWFRSVFSSHCCGGWQFMLSFLRTPRAEHGNYQASLWTTFQEQEDWQVWGVPYCLYRVLQVGVLPVLRFNLMPSIYLFFSSHLIKISPITAGISTL